MSDAAFFAPSATLDTAFEAPLATDDATSLTPYAKLEYSAYAFSMKSPANFDVASPMFFAESSAAFPMSLDTLPASSITYLAHSDAVSTAPFTAVDALFTRLDADSFTFYIAFDEESATFDITYYAPDTAFDTYVVTAFATSFAVD